jgi:hypothetical protein
MVNALFTSIQRVTNGECCRRILHLAKTVQRYFCEWRVLGLWSHIDLRLVMEARELEGKEASPTASVIDSQSVRFKERDGIGGYGARKSTKGRKRHIIVDTLGLMLGLTMRSADIQDRGGAPDLLESISHRWPCLLNVFADGAMRETS